MHSESFVEIRLLEKLGKKDFDALVGKWISVVPVSHSGGILYCGKL